MTTVAATLTAGLRILRLDLKDLGLTPEGLYVWKHSLRAVPIVSVFGFGTTPTPNN